MLYRHFLLDFVSHYVHGMFHSVHEQLSATTSTHMDAALVCANHVQHMGHIANHVQHVVWQVLEGTAHLTELEIYVFRFISSVETIKQ